MIWAFGICGIALLAFFALSTDWDDGRTAEEKMSNAIIQGFALVVAAISGAVGLVWMVIKVAML